MTRNPFPPLFFFITYADTQFFEGPFGSRLVSLLFGLLVVVALYWLGKVLLGRWCGLLATALLTSTTGVYRSQGFQLSCRSIEGPKGQRYPTRDP
jgi:4-amino-4-deoxy-L-arabinose transferase-like glycosyltransferase